MVLKGISAFPIGRLGARKKDYKKRKLLHRIIHESLCLTVFVCTYKTNILITNNMKKRLLGFRDVSKGYEDVFEIILLLKIEMHSFGNGMVCW